METPAGNKKGLSNKVVIIVAAVIVAVVIAAAAFVVLNEKDDGTGGNVIGYSTEAKVMLDEDSLQSAIDEAIENAKNGMVALQYQNDAFSDDGLTFSCHIVNAASNRYDMFLTIYADDALTDQIFLSELVPPGSGFEEITLSHALDPGDHTVYVAVTQVDNEDGQQVMKNQVIHTIEFHVEEP